MKIDAKYLPLAALLLFGFGCSASTPAEEEADSSETEESQMEEIVSAELADGSYELIADDSTFFWTGTKIGGEHTGTIEAESGSFSLEEGEVEGSIMINMATITCCEAPEDEIPSLVDHLESDDFFSTDNFPTAEFTLAGLEMQEDGTYEVSGTLTIKDIENDVTFSGTFEEDGDGYRLVAEAELDRAKWDIRYGSESFFDDLGDSVIHDEFTLVMDVLFEEAE